MEHLITVWFPHKESLCSDVGNIREDEFKPIWAAPGGAVSGFSGIGISDLYLDDHVVVLPEADPHPLLGAVGSDVEAGGPDFRVVPEGLLVFRDPVPVVRSGAP